VPYADYPELRRRERELFRMDPPPRNWLELLVDTSRVDLGGRVDERPDGRGPGYRHVWAEPGITTAELRARGWHRQAADAARHGAVDVAIVFVGHDNLRPQFERLTGNLPVPPAEVAAAVEALGQDLDAMVAELSTAPFARVVLVTLADWSRSPYLRNFDLTEERRRRIADTMRACNERIRAVGDPRRVAVFDADAYFAGVAARPAIAVAATRLFLLRPAGGDRRLGFFLDDGMHPGTAGSALLVDRFLADFNRLGIGRPISRFTPDEILALAGLAPEPPVLSRAAAAP
jgi:hypothetical protein